MLLKRIIIHHTILLHLLINLNLFFLRPLLVVLQRPLFCHYFQTLCIQSTTVLKEKKTTYRNLARFLHPNTWNTSKPHLQEEGSYKFKVVYNAYTSLIDLNC